MSDEQAESKPKSVEAESCKPSERRSTVRFTEAEGRRLRKDRLLTGRSTPWLLKTAYFKGELSPPNLSDEDSREMLRLLANFSNNHNQIARALNAGISKGVEEYLKTIAMEIRSWRMFASRDYGDR